MKEPRVQSPNFEIYQRYYLKAWCPVCGVPYDEQDFCTIDELMEQLWKQWDFLCYDCEMELQKEDK